MSFELQQREVNGVKILDLSGRLVAGEAAAALRDKVTAITQQKDKPDADRNVILNLRRVTFVDSSGLGALIACHTMISDAGGDLRLLHLSKRSAQLLILTKLTTVFQIFDDENAAVNSYLGGAEVKPFDILEFVKSQEEEDNAEEPEPAA
jgi:anti-sigma B factor antagonist